MLSIVVFVLNTSAVSQSANKDYYPLAKGNRWRYRVTRQGHRSVSYVEWRVTATVATQAGIIYQVWPFPSTADDEAMQLLFTGDGLEEHSSGAIILKSVLSEGATWSTGQEKHRKFRVIAVGSPCYASNIKAADCVTIEDDDDELRYRTITTFAKGIGPIRYTYFKRGSREHTPIQTLELVSYVLNAH